MNCLRSPTFHNFVKVSLTKNPKKRPTADKLLMVSIHFNHLILKLSYFVNLALKSKYIIKFISVTMLFCCYFKANYKIISLKFEFNPSLSYYISESFIVSVFSFSKHFYIHLISIFFLVAKYYHIDLFN